jgi:aryl-alcohol dehydrogenase-like predicted oxidoreductase
MDDGINIFEGANICGDGVAETVLGELIADHRQELVVNSKCGSRFGSAIHSQGGSRSNIMASIAASLKRLKADFMVIYYLIRPDDCAPLEVS